MDERDKRARRPLGGRGGLLLVAAGTLLGLGTLGVGAAAAADHAVAVTSNDFTPADLTIVAGDTVTWTNTQGNHNVVFEDGLFTQPAAATGPPWTRQRPFATAGTFPYYCVLHRSAGMTGVVRVAAGAPVPPPGVPSPPPGEVPAPGDELPGLKVTLKVTDATPRAGKRIRLFGTVRPEQDGRTLQIQRRARSGKFKTVATARLRAGNATRSVYSRRLQVDRDSVFRARVPGDAAHAASVSATKRVDVPAPA